MPVAEGANLATRVEHLPGVSHAKLVGIGADFWGKGSLMAASKPA